MRPTTDFADDFWSELRDVQRSIPGCVRVVVLRGLSGLPDGPAQHDWSSQPSFVSVAVIEALAEGPALDLALAADVRMVTPQAVLRGPGPAGAGALAAAVGYAQALDLAVTGRPISGTEAHHLGLAQRLVPVAHLDDAVEALVAELLAPDQDLVRELKALLLGASTRSAAAQRDAQVEAIARLNSSDPLGAPLF